MITFGNSTINFDENWKFHLGTPQSGESRFGLRKPGFTTASAGRFYNDSAWRDVTLPHDWGMELDYDYSASAHNGGVPIQSGKKTYPIGFYRKTFDVPAEWADKEIYIDFEGIFRNCEVYINGQYITHNASGYVGFYCDISDFLYYGETNSIYVRIDASVDEGWFYEGAGIYRHVWLHVLPKLHVDPRDAFIHSNIEGTNADVTAEFTVVNSSDEEQSGNFGFEIAGKTVFETLTLEPNSTQRIKHVISVDNFTAWDIENPYLYDVRIGNMSDKESMYKTRFGIRSIRFDANEGFFLNEKPVKILGSSTHQDFTGVGVALNDDIQRYKVKVLQNYGFNALRTAHNQPSPALLDICDEMGMLVMEEARMFGSSPECMSQYERTILRDRNHPSIFIWVIGNEELLQNIDIGKRQTKTIMRLIRSLDDTRPISYAANNGGTVEGINELVDVRGVNYMAARGSAEDIDEYHKFYPDQPVIGTEDSSCLATRGVYKEDPFLYHLPNFDNMGYPNLRGAESLWNELMKRPWYSGAFVWTGFDYIGEASKTTYITNFGVIDYCGYPKSTAYYYKSATAKEPVLYLYPNLNFVPEEGEKTLVRCYSNLDEVEFFADGKNMGKFKREPYRRIDLFLDEHPSEVVAIGYKDGKEAARYTLKKSGAPERLVVTPEIIGNTAFIHVETADKDGVLNPDASNRIHFSNEGCNILGVGNGNPSDEDRQFLLPVEEEFSLKCIRIHEIFENRYYCDQNLDDIVGDIEFEHSYTFRTKLVPETPEQQALHVGPTRHYPISYSAEWKNMEHPQYGLEVQCNFWADKTELSYTHLKIGYIAGIAKITLNGTELFNEDACCDGVKVPLKDSLINGENLLEIEIKPDRFAHYAIGKGISLVKTKMPEYSKRLFKGRALCMADITNGGKITVSSDNMEDITLTF